MYDELYTGFVYRKISDPFAKQGNLVERTPGCDAYNPFEMRMMSHVHRNGSVNGIHLHLSSFVRCMPGRLGLIFFLIGKLVHVFGLDPKTFFLVARSCPNFQNDLFPKVFNYFASTARYIRGHLWDTRIK